MEYYGATEDLMKLELGIIGTEMTPPLVCTLLAFGMNYLTKVPVAMAMAKENKGYDNRHPREQQARLTGWGKRALGAHLNSFEIAPLFASCVFIGHLTKGNASWSTALAVLFILSRVAYTALYIGDVHLMRSAVWGFGIFCSVGIALSGCF